MLIIPAIDLQNGHCVRLKQGQFDQVTQFADLPVDRARYFANLGAKRLHVVDLDGARMGSMQQLSLIKDMQATGITVQAGGGIRSLEHAKLCFAAGISQLVIGSIAITDPKRTQEIIQELKPEHIILALDVNIQNGNPIPASHGWQTSSATNLWQLTAYYQELGITRILCTDIACDGMNKGPNFDLYQEACERFPDIAWQASGGIRNQEDIKRLHQSGIAGVILGLSLYQNQFNLSDCLKEYEPC
ncbi:MAG: 1-(5-phosphoribosyl)-5-[(5-phosphoribosylamino)methylideneamino]imidazole-4-carboxamide isomerase [Legionella sp.]|jgi:phosphoribosylformimino-5-aminoimidazole carboxamide ribotide isomerase